MSPTGPRDRYLMAECLTWLVAVLLCCFVAVLVCWFVALLLLSLSSGSLPLALDDVDLRIEARERVGICGRTGSGKSTMTMILFRMVRRTVSVFLGTFVNTK